MNDFPVPKDKPVDQYNTPSETPQSHRGEVEALVPFAHVFEMTNLESLSMDSYPFEYISRKIGNLSQLKVLSILGSRLVCFPSEIGKLRDLTSISHYCSYSISYSPYELKQCNIKGTYISRRPNYIYNSSLLPPLPQPTNMTDIVNEFKQLFIEYELIPGLIDIVIGYLPFKECSNPKCQNKIIWKECVYYAWSMYKPSNDPICLLATMCSDKCVQSIGYGKRYYLALRTDYYVNVRVDGPSANEMVEYECLRRDYSMKSGDLNKELNRFEYFWKYKLGIKYKSYEFVQGDQNEVMVTFKE
eukprot:338393_1